MSEKTKEVKTYHDAMYTQSLHGETIYNQSMSIGCIGKRGTSLVFPIFTSKFPPSASIELFAFRGLN